MRGRGYLCPGQGIDAPESQAEADGKSSAQNQVAQNYLQEQLTKGLVTREAFDKSSKENLYWIGHRRENG